MESLKEAQLLVWIGRMYSIRSRAEEIICQSNLINKRAGTTIKVVLASLCCCSSAKSRRLLCSKNTIYGIK